MRTATHPNRRDGRARRHPHSDGDNTGKPTALDRMLAQRNRLADKIHEAEAHGHPDVLDANQLLGATEEAIRNLSRTAFRAHVNLWAEEDAQRAHASDDPRPASCLTCAYQADAGTQPATA